MDEEITAACAANGGYVLARQVRSMGISNPALQECVRTGELTRVRPGAYAVTADYQALDAPDRHRLLVRAAVGKFGDRVAVTHRSASVLHGHDQWGWDSSVVDVTRLDGGAARQEAGVHHHVGRVSGSDLTEVDGILTVVEDRAVVEACSLLTVESGLCLADSALRQGRVTREALLGRADRYRAWPGSRHARLTVRLARAKAANPGESRSRYMFWRFAIPEPTLQYEVVDEDGVLVGITDFAWLFARHLGEFDGRRKYERDLRPGEDPADVVFREKRREDGLRACDYGMSRLIWSDLTPSRRASKAAEFAGGIAESERRYRRGRVHIT